MKWRTLSDMVSTYSTGASTSEFMSEFFPGQVLPRGHTLLVSVCNAVSDSSPPVHFVSSQVSFSLKIPFLAPSHSLCVCVCVSDCDLPRSFFPLKCSFWSISSSRITEEGQPSSTEVCPSEDSHTSVCVESYGERHTILASKFSCWNAFPARSDIREAKGMWTISRGITRED